MTPQTTTTKFDTYEWQELVIPNPDDPGKKIGNTIAEMIQEVNQAPPPVSEPAPPPVVEPAPAPGVNPGGNNGPQGAIAAPGQPITNTRPLRAISADMFLKSWDMMFSNIAVMITGKSEKLAYYQAAKQQLDDLGVLLAGVFDYYNFDPSPVGAFAVGFAGIYGSKAVEIYQDTKTGSENKSIEDLDLQEQILERQIRLKKLQEEAFTPLKPKQERTTPRKPNVSTPGTAKDGTKRGGARPGSGRKPRI